MVFYEVFMLNQQPTQLRVIDAPDDCKNAPRKLVIRDFLVAFYQRDVDSLRAMLREDIRWEIVGSEAFDDLDQVLGWVQQQAAVDELHITSVITHGTDCAADGWIIGADGTTTRFCHILVFAGHTKSAKIKTLRTYRITT